MKKSDWLQHYKCFGINHISSIWYYRDKFYFLSSSKYSSTIKMSKATVTFKLLTILLLIGKYSLMYFSHFQTVANFCIKEQRSLVVKLINIRAWILHLITKLLKIIMNIENQLQLSILCWKYDSFLLTRFEKNSYIFS